MPNAIDPSYEFPVQDGAGSSAGSPFDRIKIGEFVFRRTKVEIRGSRGHKLEKKSARGATGSRITYQGTLANDFSISWILFAEETWDGDKVAHFSTWKKLAAIICPAKAKTEAARLTIEHPDLEFVNLSGEKFIVERVQVPDLAGPQQKKITIEVTLDDPLKAATTKKPKQKDSAAATEQARARYNELAAEKANTTDPFKPAQLQAQMDDIAKRYPVIGPPSPSKTSTKP